MPGNKYYRVCFTAKEYYFGKLVLTGESTDNKSNWCAERANVIIVFVNTGALSRNLVRVSLLVFK